MLRQRLLQPQSWQEQSFFPCLVTITNAQVPSHGHCPLSKVATGDCSLSTATLRGPAVLANCTAEAPGSSVSPQASLSTKVSITSTCSPLPQTPGHSCIWMGGEPEQLRFKQAPYLRSPAPWLCSGTNSPLVGRAVYLSIWRRAAWKFTALK